MNDSFFLIPNKTVSFSLRLAVLQNSNCIMIVVVEILRCFPDNTEYFFTNALFLSLLNKAVTYFLLLSLSYLIDFVAGKIWNL